MGLPERVEMEELPPPERPAPAVLPEPVALPLRARAVAVGAAVVEAEPDVALPVTALAVTA